MMVVLKAVARDDLMVDLLVVQMVDLMVVLMVDMMADKMGLTMVA